MEGGRRGIWGQPGARALCRQQNATGGEVGQVGWGHTGVSGAGLLEEAISSGAVTHG